MSNLEHRVTVSIMENERLGLLLLKNVILNEQSQIVALDMEATKVSDTPPLTAKEISDALNNGPEWVLKETIVDCTVSIRPTNLRERLEDLKAESFITMNDYLKVQKMTAEELLEEYQNYLGSRAVIERKSFKKEKVELSDGESVLLKEVLTKVKPKTGQPFERGWSCFWLNYLLECLFNHKDVATLGEHLEVLIRVAQWKDDYIIFSANGVRLVSSDFSFVSSVSSIKETLVEDYLPLLEDFRDGNNAIHLNEWIDYIKEEVTD